MTPFAGKQSVRRYETSCVGWALLVIAAVGVAALHKVFHPTYVDGWVVACIETGGRREYAMIPDEQYEIPVSAFVESPYRFGDLESVCDVLARTQRNSGVRLCVKLTMWGDPIKPFTAEEIEEVKSILKKRRRLDLVETIYDL